VLAGVLYTWLVVLFAQVDLVPAAIICFRIMAGGELCFETVLGRKESFMSRPCLPFAFQQLVECVQVEVLHVLGLLAFPCAPLRLWLGETVRLLMAWQEAAECKVRATMGMSGVLVVIQSVETVRPAALGNKTRCMIGCRTHPCSLYRSGCGCRPL